MNCLSANNHNAPESTKSRKLLRFSPKLRKRKSEKGVHGVTMATGNDGHVPNGLNDRERLEMKQAFDMFDKNNDGKISCDELGCVLRTLGHEYSQMEIEDMIKHADINENGYVEYDEFLVLMKRWSTQTVEAPEEVEKTEDKTKETFKVFDMDGNGFIDQHELRYIMKRLGENLEEEDVKEMFQLADLNGDGLIDYEEFQKLLGGLGGGLGAGASGSQAPSSSTSSSSSSSSKHTPKASKSKDGKKK
ncbi:calmodulin-A-like isoform X3 [Biomphalaria glabrata]|uniref:Calmodulin-A-like isoform X3 n=1 Tax=Biomphalaria glabrata TaxID=6526 RepID=A0A9W2ZBF5_BIOGL|nr:calmodulin-A-like isoform X3 [Biomphalaria glabrata]XP_055872293.1 calmodulin-A-like isoform X3 [Biomphalaria glabrata]